MPGEIGRSYDGPRDVVKPMPEWPNPFAASEASKRAGTRSGGEGDSSSAIVRPPTSAADPNNGDGVPKRVIRPPLRGRRKGESRAISEASTSFPRRCEGCPYQAYKCSHPSGVCPTVDKRGNEVVSRRRTNKGVRREPAAPAGE